ncbi:MAG: hypothetical protein LLG04_10980 [Parachlamydia sp.]|nr:hypothetical protein [Parachlamydia sp.]
MAQAPTAPNSGAAIQHMLSLQTEVAQSVGKDTDACIQKINALKTVILAEYSALLDEEAKRDTARIITARLQTALVENGLPRPEKPKIEIQSLSERTSALEQKCNFYRIEDGSRVESYTNYAIKAAVRSDAALCQEHTQDLIKLGTQIAQERNRLTPPNVALVSCGDAADARLKRRTEILRAENFANFPAVLRLANYSTQIRELLLAPDSTLSEEQRASRIRVLIAQMQADEAHVSGQLALFRDLTRTTILERIHTVANLCNDCVIASWSNRTSQNIPLPLYELLVQERSLPQKIAEGQNSIEIMREIVKLKGEYNRLKAEAAKPPQYPAMDQFFTYGASLVYPTSIKPDPIFENLKKEVITKKLEESWALIKAGTDRLCCDILDVRISYLTTLLTQQPENAELSQLLQKDLEERLKFFVVEITDTPATAADVNNMYGKAEVLKKSVVATKAPALADSFNNAMIKLLAKQSEWLTADFAVKHRAKAAELKSGFEALKGQVDASWNSEIEKTTLSEAASKELKDKLEGIDNPNSFEKQFGTLVNLKYLTIDVLPTPFTDKENGWLKEFPSRCIETPTLNRKISDQQKASKGAFDDQHGKLNLELNTLSQTVHDHLATPLDKVKDKVRDKDGAFQRLYGTIGTYTTRFRKWWTIGPSEAPRPATASAPPSPGSSPETSVTVAAAPAATVAPASPEKKAE